MKRIILAAMLIATSTAISAYAQSASVPNVSAQDFTIKLTGAELDVIGKGLGTQPFNDVAPLLQKLREQVQAQQPKPEQKPANEAPKP